jgi:glutamyl-tRNA(Gln) amidotransferase subunit D
VRSRELIISGYLEPSAMSEGASTHDPWNRLSALPIGTEVVITLPDGMSWRGWLLPSDPLSQPRVAHLKLSSGYNVGVFVPNDCKVEALPGIPWGEPVQAFSPDERPADSSEEAQEGAVVIIATGGTIASRVDYVTGGVKPVRGKKALETVYPGLTSGGPVVLREIFDILSEDVGPTHWTRIAQEAKSAFDHGARGVVVTHGTDTMAYTSSALAFQLRDLPGPVVLVGAQRSIDRPSSDGVTNLLSAMRIAREADLGEVVVAMHSGPSDTSVAIHRGTRVRKMHSTRRDAFRSTNEPPLGIMDRNVLHLSTHSARSGKPARLEEGFDEKGALLWIHPGLTEKVAVAHTDGARGMILAGTGMGHVPTNLVPWIKAEVKKGTVVAMTTQCLAGTVDPFVYSRGRELSAAGVLYLGDIFPETAFVKLLWALKHFPDAKQVGSAMMKEIAGEFGQSRPLEVGGSP